MQRGRTIDRFVLQSPRKNQGGSSGVVWRARDQIGPGVWQDVAIKLLTETRIDDPESDERFRREAAALMSLNACPHVVQILKFGVADGVGWIAMEFVEGSLADEAARGPATQARAVRVLREVAIALDAMHTLDPPLLHRDVKPANILVTEQGACKLADLGLAAPQHAGGTQPIGTVRYTAPEVLDPKGVECAASDLYSLGFVAYELVLGPQRFATEFPFDEPGERPATRWIQWHATEHLRATPLAQAASEVTPEFSRLVERLMAKRVAERYATARELLDDLRALGADSAPPGEHRSTGRHRVPRRALVAGAGTLALMGATAYATQGFWRTPEIVLLGGERHATQEAYAMVRASCTRPLRAGERLVLVSPGASIDMARSTRGANAFEARLELPRMGETRATVELRRGSGGTPIAAREVRATRALPERVRLALTFAPSEATTQSLVGAQAVVEVNGKSHRKPLSSGGTAEFGVPPGEYKVRLESPDFVLDPEPASIASGEDPDLAMHLRVRRARGYLRISSEQGDARVVVERDAGAALEVPLDREGRALQELETGKYTVRASAPGMEAIARTLWITKDTDERLDLSFRPETRPASAPEALDADAIRRAALRGVPLRGLLIEPAPGGGLAASCDVLSDAERDALIARLRAIDGRLECAGVVVRPDRVRAGIEADLLAAGVRVESVRWFDEAGVRRVLVQIQSNDTADAADACRVVAGHVIDPGATIVQRYADPDPPSGRGTRARK